MVILKTNLNFFLCPSDFTFIYAVPSINDNVTVFVLLIICYVFYFIGMIWAIMKDFKDAKEVSFYFILPINFAKIFKGPFHVPD